MLLRGLVVLACVCAAPEARAQAADPHSLSECLARIPAVAALVADPPAGTAAHAEPQHCNPDHSLCCSWWEVNGSLDDREPSYDELMRAIENDRKTEDLLCHGNGFVGGEKKYCNPQYGAPHCAKGFGTPAVPDTHSLANQLADLEQRMTTRLQHLRDAAAQWNTLTSGLTGFVQPDAGNPYAGIGGEAAAYGNDLQDGIAKVHALRSCIQNIQPPAAFDPYPVSNYNPYIYGLWSVDGSFGGHEDAAKINDAVGALTSTWTRSLERANRIQPPVVLDVPDRGRVTSFSPASGFQVIVGGIGALHDGGDVPTGKLPTVCVKRSAGAPTFAAPTVTVDERDGGTTLTIACNGVRVAVIDALKPDRDHDGIPDDDDDCPDERGFAKWSGCPRAPDADKDGIPDAEDKCPDQPGTRALHGCPAHRPCPSVDPRNPKEVAWGPSGSWARCTYQELLDICDATTYGRGQHACSTAASTKDDATELQELFVDSGHLGETSRECIDAFLQCGKDAWSRSYNSSPAHCIRELVDCNRAHGVGP